MVHFARPAAAVGLLAALLAYVATSILVRSFLRWFFPPAIGMLCLLLLPEEQWLLYLPPVAINLALCWLFGRTLERGREPLISRFAVMEQGALTPELASYTRTLTWIWTLLFALAAAAAGALALWAGREAWSLFTNFINTALVAALFVGEFAYRRVRFRGYQHHSLLGLLRNVRRTLT